MSTAAELLAAYDERLRGEPEVSGASRVRRIGPLWLGVFRGDRGFITYRDLDGRSGPELRSLVREATEALAADPAVVEIEWKTRGHDRAEGLHEALVDSGYAAQEPESIMIGAAELLALDLPLPDEVTLRSVTELADVRRASFAADRAFGEEPSEGRVVETMARIAEGDEMWIAEVDREIVCTGSAVPGRRYRVRGYLGRRDAGRSAGPRDLPRAHRGAGEIGGPTRLPLHHQRLDRVLAPDPRAQRFREGVDHHALRVAPLISSFRSSGARSAARTPERRNQVGRVRRRPRGAASGSTGSPAR